MTRPLDKFAGSLAGHAIIEGALAYFSASLIGREHIPRTGGALLVANHGMNGFDGIVLGALLQKEVGRLPFWLGERNLWRIPGFDRLARFIDAVPGEPHPAVELLRKGELVVVYPGGIRDSFKLASQRNQLQWGRRSGFAKVAMEAGVPIVPIAAHGVDDMYTVIAREPWIGRALLGDAKYDLPVAFGRWGSLVPRRARVTIEALPPVRTDGDPSSEADVERVRSAAASAVQAALDRGI